MEHATPKKTRGRPKVHDENLSRYQNVGRGLPLRGQARELVCNVRQYFEDEKDNDGHLLPLSQVVDRTAAALKISRNTVSNIWKEKQVLLTSEGSSLLRTPPKKRKRVSKVTSLDSFQQNAIRRHIYSYIQRQEYPTIKKLIVSLRETDLFCGSKSSLRKVLKLLGFQYQKLNRRKLLLERNDIVAWRCKFLREIRRMDFDKIVWIDETWVNTGHSRSFGWSDNSVQGVMPAPIGKGERIILLHAGKSDGFIPNCCLLFASKKTGDYHEEMNHVTFQSWFEKSLLPNLTSPSTIVMDNAPYHSKLFDKPPTTATLKADIQNWLTNHQIDYPTEFTKAELLNLVNQHKPQFPVYEIDEIANAKGHRILRLPPYHCHFNSIELIWAQVKGYVATHNKKFNVSEITRLTKEAIGLITGEEWKKVVDHTKKTINEAWEQEGLVEEAVERLIISVNDDNDSDDSSDEERSQHEDDPVCGDDMGNVAGEEIHYETEQFNSQNSDEFFPVSPLNERQLSFLEF